MTALPKSEQTAREDCANALQILGHAARFEGAVGICEVEVEDLRTVERLLRHALTQLEPK